MFRGCARSTFNDCTAVWHVHDPTAMGSAITERRLRGAASQAHSSVLLPLQPTAFNRSTLGITAWYAWENLGEGRPALDTAYEGGAGMPRLDASWRILDFMPSTLLACASFIAWATSSFSFSTPCVCSRGLWVVGNALQGCAPAKTSCCCCPDDSPGVAGGQRRPPNQSTSKKHSKGQNRM